MDRKTYMRDIYAKYWINAREKKYGFLKYDKNLCGYLSNNITNGAKLLDVGIGTGYPFGYFFDKAGYKVSGMDIAPSLIKKCRELYPNIEAKVGDAENIPYPDNSFDAVYCFHSSWYFLDLNKAIDEMLRAAKSGGLVIFDVINGNNSLIRDDCQNEKKLNSGFGIAKKYMMSIAKMILHRGTPDWHLVVSTTPAVPEEICRHFRDINIANFKIMAEEKDGSISLQKSYGSFEEYGRLIFEIKK